MTMMTMMMINTEMQLVGRQIDNKQFPKKFPCQTTFPIGCLPLTMP